MSDPRTEPRRIAALYDIHGNLPALEAALGAVAQAGADLIVVGGDVFPGPMAIECLELLRSLQTPVRFLTGNGDRETLAIVNGAEPTGVPEVHRGPMCWVAAQLSVDHAREIASWPATIRMNLPTLGSVLFCHGTPTSDTAIFTKVTPESQLASTFSEVSADVVVCGHTHMPFDRTIAGRRVVNAGSVGMPFGRGGAHWLLLNGEADSTITAMVTDYDRVAAAARIRQSKYPESDNFASSNVLSTPSEDEMLQLFSRVQIGGSRQS